MFDSAPVAHDRGGPDRDRLTVARLAGSAHRYARWGALTRAQRAAGAAELREIVGDRPDLLAEVAGIALGTVEGKGREYVARGQAVADLCRAAGASEDLIPGWIEEGRRRAELRRHPPFSRPGRTPRRP